MNFSEYQEQSRRTRPSAPSTNAVEEIMTLIVAALGLCGESGEVADIIKKHVAQGHPFDRGKIINEAGDIMWYLSLLCDALGITMEQVAVLNIEKLRKRYPDGFSAERSMNREG